MRKPVLYNAILALVGGELSGSSNYNSFIYHSGQTPPTKEEANTKLAELISDWNAQEYARDRAESYPSIGDQLDMLMKDMKDGTTTHQTACEAVKAKYPKP